MPEKFGGKIFYSQEEGEKLGLTPTEEEMARTLKSLEEFEARHAASPPPVPEGTPADIPSRFRDDLVGTEFAGWTRDQNGNWYDQHGRPAYDTAGRRIQYPDDESPGGDK